MVICAVFGCSKRSGRDSVSFFRIPCVDMKRNYKCSELLLKRQKLWIIRVNREDLDETKIKHARICSLHFISGKPSSLQDVDNPDWAPSVNLGYGKMKNVAGTVERHQREMPSKCCVPLCKGNYETGPKVSVFLFPRDEENILKWLKAIRRANFYPSKTSRVCSRHFRDSDFLREISAYDHKTGRTLTAPLSCIRLKKEAVPSIFPEFDSYDKSLNQEPSEGMQLVKEQKNTPSTAPESVLNKKMRESNISIRNESQEIEKKKPGRRKKRRGPFKSISSKVKDSSEKSQLNSNDITSSNEAKTDQSHSLSVSSQSLPDIHIKEEKPWEEEYKYFGNSSGDMSKDCDKMQIEIREVRSVPSSENNEQVDTSKRKISSLSKPLKIQKREEIFGKLVASEMSDLYETPELYIKTKQSILNLLVQARFDQMKSSGEVS